MKNLILILLTVIIFSGCVESEPQYYSCIIGCGNENFTPQKGYYYDSSSPTKQIPLSELYEKHR